MQPQYNAPYRMAGLAALMCAGCFVVGFVMIFYIEPGIHLNPHQRLAFILSNGRYFQLWYLIIFVLFGINLLVLTQGINRFISPYQTLSYHLTMMFGFIWASYVIACGLIATLSIEYLLHLPENEQSSVWFAIYSLQTGLGDGVEWVGGVWLLSLSLHALYFRLPYKLLNTFGAIIGFIGCLTLVPVLSSAGVVFGLTQILWFVAVGITFIRRSRTIQTQGALASK
ncbi:hypothetical protein [Aestuariibacter sp. A3R04]|uniref:hypothetical protein n=1 Tax=Aestuariibacter sp. A3R04 TaxID=2841571 RepID=UPI001C0997EB|nr:hypothetical protein [Aestuariibacter sp. A3R04]MBU3023814.1 hypothetical protein [Aestuariibacter sp. A3R04]